MDRYSSFDLDARLLATGSTIAAVSGAGDRFVVDWRPAKPWDRPRAPRWFRQGMYPPSRPTWHTDFGPMCLAIKTHRDPARAAYDARSLRMGA